MMMSSCRIIYMDIINIWLIRSSLYHNIFMNFAAVVIFKKNNSPGKGLKSGKICKVIVQYCLLQKPTLGL